MFCNLSGEGERIPYHASPQSAGAKNYMRAFRLHASDGAAASLSTFVPEGSKRLAQSPPPPPTPRNKGLRSCKHKQASSGVVGLLKKMNLLYISSYIRSSVALRESAIVQWESPFLACTRSWVQSSAVKWFSSGRWWERPSPEKPWGDTSNLDR